MAVSAAKFRLGEPARLRIFQLRMQGHSWSEIGRRTKHCRETCRKILRDPEIQTRMRQLKERLLGESDEWAKSISFAVRTEVNGQLAFKLLERFDVIPSRADAP
jgi:hypothetical protein